jgi:hypothetical protein
MRRKGNKPQLPIRSPYITLLRAEEHFLYSQDSLRHMAAEGIIGSVKLKGPKSKLLLVRADLEDLFARHTRPRRELVTR